MSRGSAAVRGWVDPAARWSRDPEAGNWPPVSDDGRTAVIAAAERYYCNLAALDT